MGPLALRLRAAHRVWRGHAGCLRSGCHCRTRRPWPYRWPRPLGVPSTPSSAAASGAIAVPLLVDVALASFGLSRTCSHNATSGARRRARTRSATRSRHHRVLRKTTHEELRRPPCRRSSQRRGEPTQLQQPRRTRRVRGMSTSCQGPRYSWPRWAPTAQVEIAGALSLAQARGAVITSIGPAHLERFGTLDRTLAAKADITPDGRVGRANIDDERSTARATSRRQPEGNARLGKR